MRLRGYFFLKCVLALIGSMAFAAHDAHALTVESSGFESCEDAGYHQPDACWKTVKVIISTNNNWESASIVQLAYGRPSHEAHFRFDGESEATFRILDEVVFYHEGRQYRGQSNRFIVPYDPRYAKGTFIERALSGPEILRTRKYFLAGEQTVSGLFSFEASDFQGTEIIGTIFDDFAAESISLPSMAVPLPAAGLLLLSGLASVIGLKRRQKQLI